MDYAILASLLLILASVWAVIALGLALVRTFNTIQESFRSFVDAPGDGQPSPLALVAQLIGQTAGKSITASVMAQMSAEQRQVNGLMRDAALDTAEANPIVGALLGAAGNRTRNRLAKNPALLQAIGQLVSNFAGSKSSGSNGEKPRFEFKV